MKQRLAILGCGILVALAGVALARREGASTPQPDPVAYDALLSRVADIPWSERLERHVASILINEGVDLDALNADLAGLRPALDDIADMARRGGLVLPEGRANSRLSPDDWEFVALLMAGDALVLVAEDEKAALARLEDIGALATALHHAGGAGLGELATGYGVQEIMLIQMQRMMTETRSRSLLDGLTGQLNKSTGDPWPAIVRLQGGRAVTEARQAQALYNQVARRTIDQCTALPAMPVPDLSPAERTGANPVGTLMVRLNEIGLVTLSGRRCHVEASRRASLLMTDLHRDRLRRGALPAVLPPDSAVDPFSGSIFGYEKSPARLWSAGRDNESSDGPGSGPYDDRAPTFFLE